MDNNEKLVQIRQLLQSAEASLESAKHLLSQVTGEEEAPPSSGESFLDAARQMGSVLQEGTNRIINGIFDGQHMIGPDGKQYSVPANYASKSKLVEGDMLKLTIMQDGTFVYKQVGPVDRNRVIGQLSYDEASEQWLVTVNGNIYKVLLASVTYFKGDIGDEVVLLLPKAKSAVWGAVENIIKKGQERPILLDEEVTGLDHDVGAQDAVQEQATPKDSLDEL